MGHELGHVVQQKQGRVRATGSIGSVAVNDDAGLEKEADRMGAFPEKAIQAKPMETEIAQSSVVIQLDPWVKMGTYEIDLATGKRRDAVTKEDLAVTVRGEGRHTIGNLVAGSRSSAGIGSLYFETPRRIKSVPDASEFSQDRIRLVHKSGPEISREHKNVTWDISSGQIKETKDKKNKREEFHTSRGMPYWNTNYSGKKEKVGQEEMKVAAKDQGIEAGVTQEGLNTLEKVASLPMPITKDKKEKAAAIYEKNRLMTLATREQIELGKLPENLGQEVPFAILADNPKKFHAGLGPGTYTKALASAIETGTIRMNDLKKSRDNYLETLSKTSLKALSKTSPKACEIIKALHNIINNKNTKKFNDHSKEAQESIDQATESTNQSRKIQESVNPSLNAVISKETDIIISILSSALQEAEKDLKKYRKFQDNEDTTTWD